MKPVDRSVHASQVDRLRQQFDDAFAAPLPPERPPHERLLLVSAGALRFALPSNHCANVIQATSVTALPAQEHGFVGLVPIGGVILPVYDLAARVERGARADAARGWLLVTVGADRVAFLVDTVDGHTARDLHPDGDTAPVITVDGIVRRYISLAAIVATLSDSIRRTEQTRSVR
jgi:chemotaxis signal transduction protein